MVIVITTELNPGLSLFSLYTHTHTQYILSVIVSGSIWHFKIAFEKDWICYLMVNNGMTRGRAGHLFCPQTHFIS